MTRLGASLVLFYGVSPTSVLRGECRAADWISKASQGTDGYLTWDGMRVEHPRVGWEGFGCGRGRLPGVRSQVGDVRSVSRIDDTTKRSHMAQKHRANA